jgi:hypothetical protein
MQNRNRKPCSVTFDPATLEEIDERRGKIPRSVYMEDLVLEALRIDNQKVV